jgi:hypothetical protein
MFNRGDLTVLLIIGFELSRAFFLDNQRNPVGSNNSAEHFVL